jgi:hypothetical protein
MSLVDITRLSKQIPAMKRTLVDLEEKDLTELDLLAADWRTSRASVLREAVSEYLVKRERVPAAPPKPLEGFGALKDRLPDGQIYQDNLRADWE